MSSSSTDIIVQDEKLAALMAQLEEEVEAIVEDDDALQSDLKNKSLRMRTPEQIDASKKEAETQTLTSAQKRARLQKLIRGKRADRTRSAASGSSSSVGGPRITQQQMHKARTGQLGLSANNIDLDKISPEMMEQAKEMLRRNPQLEP
jgi:predicted house-cleaning noncanonical NTP pyrophosphatase (MazG superfamily)